MIRTQEILNDVVIKFAGDSGDGMQLTGSQFTNNTALMGIDLATFPDFPAEIRAPIGTLPGVSGYQLRFSSDRVFTPGDACDVLVAMNAAALKTNLNGLKKGGKISIELPASHNAIIYLLDGKLTLEGFGLIESLNAAMFKKDGEGITFEALEDTRVLLLSGEPLNEKVVSHGPFVMNTQTQIMEAMRDYQVGKMGVLIEERLK